MKIILAIITALTFFIGVMVNKMALSIGEQIYAALYYIMALISFCTLSVLFDGKFTCSCNWLRRECGLPESKLADEEEVSAYNDAEEAKENGFIDEKADETDFTGEEADSYTAENDDDENDLTDEIDETEEADENDADDETDEDEEDETVETDGRRKKFVKTIIITNRNN